MNETIKPALPEILQRTAHNACQRQDDTFHTAMHEKQERPALDIHLNNAAVLEPCALCGQETGSECGPELFVAGTEQVVCLGCGKKYEPEMVAMLTAYRDSFEPQSQIKQDLLDKYANRPVTAFEQYDAFIVGPNDRDDIMNPRRRWALSL